MLEELGMTVLRQHYNTVVQVLYIPKCRPNARCVREEFGKPTSPKPSDDCQAVSTNEELVLTPTAEVPGSSAQVLRWPACCYSVDAPHFVHVLILLIISAQPHPKMYICMYVYLLEENVIPAILS